MVKKYNLPFKEEELNLIVELVNPSDENKNNWLYQIIANKYCSIDVDKIDYIQRDSYHLGFGVPKYERLITMCDVKELDGHNVLAWPDKLQDEIMSLFATRYKLHKNVYNHNTVQAAEFIIIELLKEIKKHTNIKFEDLYDDIIAFPFDIPRIKMLQRDFDNRIYPKLIGEHIITVCTDQLDERLTKENNIVLFSKSFEGVSLLSTRIGFISGNGENPLKNVPYFNKYSKETYKTTNYSSFMAPQNCQEYIYRAYKNNSENIDKYREMWKAWEK